MMAFVLAMCGNVMIAVYLDIVLHIIAQNYIDRIEYLCVVKCVFSIRLIVSLGVVTSSRMKCKTLSCVYNLRETEKSIMT